MRIKRLQVEKLRNLEAVDLSGFSTLNVFYGGNGSGKTSLLEAISIASQGRSFRHHKIQTVINHKQPSLQVFVLCESDAGVDYRLGILRDRDNQYQIKINGESVSSLAELTSFLPILVLDASAFDLLDGPPMQRCRFIDWAVFHVEHQFFVCWRNYSRLLKQRNTLLKQGIQSYEQLKPWDIEFVKLAVEIERYRCKVLITFSVYLKQVLPQLDVSLVNVEVFYRNGWQEEKLALMDKGEGEALDVFSSETLLSRLEQSFARDQKYQRTHLGPHRADLQIRIMQNDARDVLSRGQKKTLISAMKLAQAKMLAQVNGLKPILLLDDLPAELDREHLKSFIEVVLEENLQSFITTVNQQFVEELNLAAKCNMFHVERGRIEPFTACK